MPCGSVKYESPRPPPRVLQLAHGGSSSWLGEIVRISPAARRCATSFGWPSVRWTMSSPGRPSASNVGPRVQYRECRSLEHLRSPLRPTEAKAPEECFAGRSNRQPRAALSTGLVEKEQFAHAGSVVVRSLRLPHLIEPCPQTRQGGLGGCRYVPEPHLLRERGDRRCRPW